MHLKVIVLASLNLNSVFGFVGADWRKEFQRPMFGWNKAKTLKDRYIVVFKDGITPYDNEYTSHFQQLHTTIQHYNSINNNQENSIRHLYQNALVGYSGTFSSEVLDTIKKSKIVHYVEKDNIMRITETQSSAPWGLARISHKEKLNQNTYDKYIYDTNYYNNVTIFVVDTGIILDHEEFEGRASWGATFARNSPDTDDNGHGTHVAGIVGGKTYGVAKKANLVAVKVLDADGTGYTSDLIAGINYILSVVQPKGEQSASFVPVTSIINISASGPLSNSLNQIINMSAFSGVQYIVSAGSTNSDACLTSPGSAEAATTVGATDINDEKTPQSNQGFCIDVFAPGKSILSSYIGSNTAKTYLSGTSAATPHVAGLAAYFIMTSQTPMSNLQLYYILTASATPDIIKGLDPDTSNLLVNNGSGL
ncbi:Subtilisin-like protease [Zancudomyces culisetae]|uniref:Subtilisin-like protease n=1 Tax=Zancudomyces culisetae TaxID=1213189 RepID=A0A1R1PK74_ZANCU|nr:Subtilisin-like protease [Zancudomyces culisetae]|eukprot:OMH81365.1 Subtilisin-like protease [Zancudomyces culisetae]